MMLLVRPCNAGGASGISLGPLFWEQCSGGGGGTTSEFWCASLSWVF